MNSVKTLALLRRYESRNATFIENDGSWPIVWDRAKGVHVWDAEGKRYLDLTAAFGVAAAGHANPRVVKAGQKQMKRLLHAMGDVHPHALKAQLARELSRITFERWPNLKSKGSRLKSKAESRALGSESRFENHTAKTIFCNSGFEAVEAALKTALLATNKPGVIAFSGAYHGLGYGALNATERKHFRFPFRTQLRQFARFVPFPVRSEELGAVEKQVRQILRRERIGALLVEPIQVRGGIKIPPPRFLQMLRRLCDEGGAVLIFDEIYTGFGRTGKWFACEHSAVVPDIICLGKALTGGFPLSACVGRAELMDTAWPASRGEAIHTSTFLGHPVGCAMALAQIEEIKKRDLVSRSAALGKFLLKLLSTLHTTHLPRSTLSLNFRGLGLLVGLDVRRPDGTPATNEALKLTKAMLHRGFILLPEGEHSNVISFTPPLAISRTDLARTVQALRQVILCSRSSR